MLPENFFESGSIFKIDRSIPRKSGAEKIVWPVRKNGILYAAKIFREVNDSSLKPINRIRAARREFDAYERTSNSVIGRFVPPPVELIIENGKEIGLIVFWRNGLPVADFFKRELIPEELFVDFEQSLLQLPKGLWLIDDSIADANVCFDGSELWLAEPRLRYYPSYKKYKTMVNTQLSYLKDNYSK